jgi:hypothetical protein
LIWAFEQRDVAPNRPIKVLQTSRASKAEEAETLAKAQAAERAAALAAKQKAGRDARYAARKTAKKSGGRVLATSRNIGFEAIADIASCWRTG